MKCISEVNRQKHFTVVLRPTDQSIERLATLSMAVSSSCNAKATLCTINEGNTACHINYHDNCYDNCVGSTLSTSQKGHVIPTTHIIIAITGCTSEIKCPLTSEGNCVLTIDAQSPGQEEDETQCTSEQLNWLHTMMKILKLEQCSIMDLYSENGIIYTIIIILLVQESEFAHPYMYVSH